MLFRNLLERTEEACESFWYDGVGGFWVPVGAYDQDEADYFVKRLHRVLVIVTPEAGPCSVVEGSPWHRWAEKHLDEIRTPHWRLFAVMTREWLNPNARAGAANGLVYVEGVDDPRRIESIVTDCGAAVLSNKTDSPVAVPATIEGPEWYPLLPGTAQLQVLLSCDYEFIRRTVWDEELQLARLLEG